MRGLEIISSNAGSASVSTITYASFDGVDDAINVADSNLLNPTGGAFSFEARIFCAAKGSGQTIFRKDNQYLLIIDADGTIRPHLYIGGAYRIVTSGTYKLPFNAWNHVACVYTGSEMMLFVNAVERGARVNYTGVVANSADMLYIGARSANRDVLAGKIDVLRFWDKALTINELTANINAVFGTQQAGLIANWEFSGNANDSSGNNLHGTAVNGVIFGQE